MPKDFSKFEYLTDIESFCNIESPTTRNEELEDEDRIAKSYIGQVIFITGATGFLGKALLEVLLRSCPGIKKVYLLIRNKRGKSAQERLVKDLLSSELFSVLRKEPHGEEALRKVKAIGGDVILPDLGISPEDRKCLAEEVTIIYHGAATVRFDEKLHSAILINTRGTKLMLELAKECKKLELFAYISTAYCYPQHPHLMEQPYDPPTDPEKMIAACEILDIDTINHLEKKLLGDIPNTYTLSKALSENLVVQSFSELPAVIYRPSIVLPVWKLPIPGWTDNINGALGLLIAAAKGVLRSMFGDSSARGDYIPADCVVNGILISTWHSLSTKDFSKRVTHMTNSNEWKVTWGDIIGTGRYIARNRVPMNGIAWYPAGELTKNIYYHKFRLFFYMWLPSILGDILIWCHRYPPVLCRVQRKINKGMDLLDYYCRNQWYFDNSQAVRFRKLLNNREKSTYILDLSKLDLFQYLENMLLCVRRIYFKTPDEMLRAAKRQMKIMYWVDRTIKTLFAIWVLYFIYCKFVYPFVPHDDSSDEIVEEIINKTV